VSFNKAAAAGLVYVTAWHSLITRGGLKPGESVLIVGAGGGVNSASIQIAKLAGATVYVVGSNAEKCTKAKELGADITINREETPQWSKAIYQMTNKQGVDIVIDNVGAATFNDSIRSARIGGRILVVGNTSGPIVELDLRQVFSRQISIIGSTMGPHQDFVKVMNLVFAGRLKPVIGVILPLDEVRKGMEMLEQFDVFGKVVLEI
jgi:NADPH:quinone reductase-like Zn-dependent oxidoreductase